MAEMVGAFLEQIRQGIETFAEPCGNALCLNDELAILKKQEKQFEDELKKLRSDKPITPKAERH